MFTKKELKKYITERNDLPFGDHILSGQSTILISRDDFLKQLEIQIHQEQWK
ncbi:hypothetical protein [Aquimarina algiphila]|uniref:hypothetical protein n=1 Tax=Aquimarina algiphila TaxID=2047982 RepID=UPI00248F7A31|nr:hypothetical protein [Aquimarina algiphila]